MNYKTVSYVLTIGILLIAGFESHGQMSIKPPKGYTTQIGNMIAMLDDLKARVTRSVTNLNQSQTDFLLDENANRIGALIYHLAATEKYYQVYTFEGRNFNEEESSKWQMALSLGDEARKTLRNKPIEYYLDIWNQVREETKRLLKSKDDKWFNTKVKRGGMTNHWAWFHVMEHQANHMGQINFFTKRMDD